MIAYCKQLIFFKKKKKLRLLVTQKLCGQCFKTLHEINNSTACRSYKKWFYCKCIVISISINDNFDTTQRSIGDNNLYTCSKCVAALLPFSKINDLKFLKADPTKFIYSNLFDKLLYR